MRSRCDSNKSHHDRRKIGAEGMAGDIDREGVEKAYGRWAPVYDLVFGKVFDHGRQSTIAEADKIGGRLLVARGGPGLSLSACFRDTRPCGVAIFAPMLCPALY